MSRQKLKRFAENANSENVIEPGKEIYNSIKGKWHSDYFKNDFPITLELACGQGEYTIGLAQMCIDRNFIGIDIKGSRFWKGSTLAQEWGLKNVAFLRTVIQNLDRFFSPGEVSEIWITFPDPRPKNRDIRRRLTYPRFLEMYKRILKPEGIVHLKTDSRELTDFTLEVLKEMKIEPLQLTFDLYREPYFNETHHDIKTKYERTYLSEDKSINYLSFKFS
jgi:tRNA (guanine-N7-)-methyltransferase